jgi:hypothetical protein
MSEQYKVSSKKEIPKLDVDILMSTIGIEIYLEIFREEAQPIVNIESYEGLNPNSSLLCFGFREDGSPAISNDQRSEIKYLIMGSKASQGFITPNYSKGRRFTNEFRQVTILKGWDAIGSYCKCSPEFCKQEIQKRIYVRRVCNLVGLSDDFGLFHNPTIFSGEDWSRHNIDLNSVFNKILLPKLHSKWRILTNEVRSSIQAKRNAQLSKEYAEI